MQQFPTGRVPMLQTPIRIHTNQHILSHPWPTQRPPLHIGRGHWFLHIRIQYIRLLCRKHVKYSNRPVPAPRRNVLVIGVKPHAKSPHGQVPEGVLVTNFDVAVLDAV